MLLNQITRQTEQVVCCGKVFHKEKRTKKIYAQVNKYSYNWILQHSHVVQYPIANYLLKVSIDGHSEPQLVPKLLQQVYVQELHNSTVSTP